MRIVIRENNMEEIEGISPEYPYAFHYVEMKDTRVPWHWHEEVEFDRVLTGTAKLKLAGRTLVDGAVRIRCIHVHQPVHHANREVEGRLGLQAHEDQHERRQGNEVPDRRAVQQERHDRPILFAQDVFAHAVQR